MISLLTLTPGTLLSSLASINVSKIGLLFDALGVMLFLFSMMSMGSESYQMYGYGPNWEMHKNFKVFINIALMLLGLFLLFAPTSLILSIIQML